ncbi:MAG TPA: rhodanese-like domain-containing protein [Acidobacteriota bacterium]|nr:rhodanese-like domain-containing protein [Acidobacteriota bacterium]
MKRIVSQIIFFVLLAAVLAVIRNVAAPGGIEWVGHWSGMSPGSTDSTEVPLSAAPGDPPFLTFAEAVALHDNPDVIFVDARYPEEYEEGAIPGAVLLPFEAFDDYWPGAEPLLPKDRHLITYCSGDECELSLFLARLLKDMGYDRVSIFYGGARLWRDNGMSLDTLKAPVPGAQLEG